MLRREKHPVAFNNVTSRRKEKKNEPKITACPSPTLYSAPWPKCDQDNQEKLPTQSSSPQHNIQHIMHHKQYKYNSRHRHHRKYQHSPPLRCHHPSSLRHPTKSSYQSTKQQRNSPNTRAPINITRKMSPSRNSSPNSTPTTMTRNSPVIAQKPTHANTCASPLAQTSTRILISATPCSTKQKHLLDRQRNNRRYRKNLEPPHRRKRVETNTRTFRQHRKRNPIPTAFVRKYERNSPRKYSPNANCRNSEHGTPTEYYSHQGRPPDPSVLFRSSSAGSVPTEYYSTQGRPPDGLREGHPTEYRPPQ